MVVLKTDKPVFLQAEDGIRGHCVTGVQTCALPINVGETGDPAMTPGTSKMLTIDMAEGHYAIVCNLRSEERRVGKECRCRTPKDQTQINASVTDTDPTHKAIDLYHS